MDPNLIVTAALTAADEIITLIKHIQAQGGLTDDQLSAHAEAQDLANLDEIKKLLAM